MPDLEQVTISIDGQRWQFWEAIEVTLSLDNFATISFTSLFEPDQQLFRDTFQPFTYKDLTVDVGEQRLFTGQLVGVQPRAEPSRVTVECSGYSLPAKLADIAPPISEFPLEFNGMTLDQIAASLAEPLGVLTEFFGDPGAAFRRVKIKPDVKIYDFLIKLAKQRNFVIGDTPEGNMRFFRGADSGVPVVKFKEGQQPLVSVAATFDPQSYFSEITGFAKTKAARAGSRYTVTNPKLPTTTRSLSFIAEDVKAPDLPTAVNNKMARMFGNAASYVISEIPTWRDPAGNLWKPDTLISLEAPGAMVYSENEFVIRDVILSQSAAQTSAKLGVVLPGSFSGQIPRVLPWE